MDLVMTLLLNHFSISTVLSLLVLELLRTPASTNSPIYLLLIIQMLILFLETHKTERDSLEIIKNKKVNGKKHFPIITITVLGFMTYLWSVKGSLEVYYFTLAQLIWAIIAYLIWLVVYTYFKNKN